MYITRCGSFNESGEPRTSCIVYKNALWIVVISILLYWVEVTSIAVTSILYFQSLNISTHIYRHSQKVINLVKSHNADAWHFAIRKVRPQSHYPTLRHNDNKYSSFILRFVKSTGKNSKPCHIYYSLSILFLIFKVL